MASKEAKEKMQLCKDGLMELYSTLNETEPEAVYATLLGLHQLAGEALAALEPKCDWIPVSEGVPSLPVGPPNASSEDVWLIFKGNPHIGYYTNFTGWRVRGIRFQKRLMQKDITHWKPIVLPKEPCSECGDSGEVDDTIHSVNAGVDINKPCPKSCKPKPEPSSELVRYFKKAIGVAERAIKYSREMLTDLREAYSRIEQLIEERDLAIAHDRQPYPTAQAYEKVCGALRKTKVNIEQLEAENKQLLELSENLDEHPEGYDGPCLCKLCKSYG